ncbi:MAG: outer membrane beta-barrel protein [Balneolia bacterium]|nr:outer membrane beta-barrel protein [Balneolia bacterium]
MSAPASVSRASDMMMKFFILFILLLFVVAVPSLTAQDGRPNLFMTGTITDGADGEPLQGANVALFSAADTVLVRGATTDAEGIFQLVRVPAGDFIFQVSFVGYFTEIENISWDGSAPLTRNLTLRVDEQQLDEVRIVGRLPRMEVRGDTTAYNADAFTTNRDATVEDLIARMPGIVVRDGQVEAQGEQIRRVLVDGNEFFGDDATLAIRNLPAEIVQQIEVFDRMGDQARFTGFDDGSQERTLNIVTRSGIRNGQFGRLQTGYGSDERYTGSGNYNYFSGDTRFSVLGLTNNINQQNFAGEDLVGVSEAAGGGGRGGQWRGRAATREFMVGQQPGISTTHSVGLNYIDKWGQDFTINSSYFFNASDNTNERLSERQYTGGFAGDQFYDEFSSGSADNYNHRFNMRAEYQMTERSSFVFTPRVNLQQNSSNNIFEAFTFSNQRALLNQTENVNSSDRFGYDMSGSLLFRHRFNTPGRTMSVNLRGDANNRTGDQFRIGETVFFDSNANEIVENQRTDIDDGGYTVSTNVSLTESVSERSQLQLSYNPSFNLNRSDREAFIFVEETGDYDLLDASLSNRFENEVWRQRVSTGYNYRHDRYRLNLNFAYENTLLKGAQEFPFEADTRQVYNNLLPSATLTFNVGQTNNVRINYRTNTRTPSANQLQDVIDNTNPLRLSGGNPDLMQQYTHSLSTRIRFASPQQGSSTVVFLNASFTQDTIGNVDFIAQQDTLIQNNIFLGQGSRLVRPDNVGDSWNLRAFVSRGWVMDLISSNVNINGGGSFNSTPAAINELRYTSNTWSLNSGAVVSSNISPEIDFRLSYQANYNIVDNSVPTGFDQNYYVGTASARINLQPWRGLILESDTRIRHFSGLQDDFNNDSIFWNAAIGYKFMENRAAEIKFTVVDILNQNNNINRVIQDTFIEDVRSNVLSRYAMVSFSYNFRAIQAGAPQQQRGRGMGPGGGEWRRG